jgi:glucose/arabinose dehydrogenase
MEKRRSVFSKRVLLTCLGLVAILVVSFVLNSIRTTRADLLERPLMVVPNDFSDTAVANVAGPTALAFTPDGRMLVTTQGGTLRVVQNGALVATPALDLTSRVCSDFERGLLGVAVDPAFATNNRIYLYYTFMKFGGCARNASNSPVNRVSRFTLPANNVVSPASEVVIVDNIPSPNGNHNAGNVQFGKDGFLYISAGDGGCQLTNPSACGGANQNARRMDIPSGKILRVDTNGVPAAGNPWLNLSGSRRCTDPAGVPAGTGPCQETFAWGLRNPFRMGFDSNAAGTRFFINDVGELTWEEIDQAQSGADYGWSVREGHCATGSTTNCGAPPAGMTNPIFDYGRSTNCASITGGAFVPNGLWPASFNGAYLYSDFVCGRIFVLTPNGSGGFTSSDFATGLGSNSAVDLVFGPNGGSQALYYTTFAGGGQVRRIMFTGSMSPTNTPTRTSTPAPPTNTPTRTSTSVPPTNTPTRTMTPTGSPTQVDLTITGMQIVMAGFNGRCVPVLTGSVEVRLTVQNIGTAASGPFVVDVNGVQQTVSGGLAAGQTLQMSFPGVAGTNVATVDATNLVAESDETNNTRSQVSPTMTPPPVCTPTPPPPQSPTPTSTATPTRTPTPGQVGTCSPVNATITAPFTFDGAGTLCWRSSNLGNNTNNWNLQSLTINGVDFTGKFVFTSQLPPKAADGFWYISYTGNFPWSHFEAR